MNKRGYTNSRVNVLGVGVNTINMSVAVRTIDQWVHSGQRHYVCLAGVHGVMECQKDENLKKIHSASGLTVPDGMPMVWAGKIYGHKEMGRVYGPDLMTELFSLSAKRGFTHFLYGGKAGVAEELKRTLELKFPGVKIVGTFTPPFRPLNKEEERELIDQVALCMPDIFWVGISTPKQVYFMGEFMEKLEAKVLIGVGAAFDIHSGRLKEAPDWVKKSGMQWFHRLCQEPRRLWWRYLYYNPVFLCKFGRQVLQDKLLRRKINGD